ncbi:VanZ family protein [Streptomyces halobius]|uniref:VanZ family protein n=1 Tax=Streptomyces halobius TaxID=2879846 RepID=A0ABY4M2U0_9ACTN|nr:VanZ family protein [Streptomyces halobius]UQA92090.1 VanZ family protein [Streptomyces halobius]
MTGAYLLPIGTAALLFPALAFAMFVPTAVVLYRRHGVMTRWRVLSLYGGVYYALTAFCMTIVPLPKPSVDVCTAYPSFVDPQFTPGVAFSDIWKEAHHRVTLDALILHNPALWQTVFNLVLLLPLGAFVRIHFRRGLAAATAAGFAGSLFFELTQYSGLWGLYECPYRLFAVDDLIVNTAGAALGWAAAGPLARALPALDALDDRALAPLAAGKVPFGRRLVALLLDVTGTVLLTPVVAAIGYFVLGAETVLLAPPVAFGLWFVLIPWLTGATPGKHVLLLRLVTPDGGRPSPARLALRALLLSPLLLLTCLGGGAALSLATSAVFVGATASAANPAALIEIAGQLNYQEVAYSLAADPVAGLVLLLPPALCLTLIGACVRAIRRHPQGLGPHETLSGIRNHALPHTRARTSPDAPEPADPHMPAPVAAADGSHTGG